MSMGAESASQIVRERQHGNVVLIKKPTLRQRIGRWVLGDSSSQHPLMNMSVNAMDTDMIEKKRATEEVDGGMRFRIIPAANGKIIGYFPQRDDATARRIPSNGEQYFVVKEGDDMMGALARCLALDRIKQE